MPIQLACPSCAKQFRVADEHAGKKVKCPNCQTIFQVPSPKGDSPLPNYAYPPTPVQPPTATNPYAAQTPSQATGPMHRPAPLDGPVVSVPLPPATDPAETLGNIGLTLGIIALVGEFVSVIFSCCCGIFALGPGLMAIPSGVGLALSLKARGGTRVPGIIINGIALAIAVVAIVIVVVLMILYGGLIAFSLSQQPKANSFGP
jgi:predicted Zn finger-like uncharacterized protein